MKNVNFALIALVAMFLLIAIACAPTETQSDEPNPDEEAISGQTGGDEDPVPEEEENLPSVVRTEGIPEGWPEYIPIMEGFTVTEGQDGNRKEIDPGMIVSAVGDVPMLEVAEYYSSIEGWEKDERSGFAEPTEAGFTMTFTREEREHLMVTGTITTDNRSGLSLTYIYSTG